MRHKLLLGIAAIVIILIAIIAIIPWYCGNEFKKNYLTFIANFNSQHPDKIQVIAYQQGWLHSQATLAMRDNHITIEQTIDHGPLLQDPITKATTMGLASIQTELHGPVAFEATLLGNQQLHGFVQLHSLVTTDRRVITQLTMPPISFNNQSGSITWQGMTGTVILSTTETLFIKSITHQFNIGALSGQSSAMGSINIGAFTTGSAATMLANGLAQGRSELDIPSITLAHVAGNDVSVTALKNSYTLDMTGTRFYRIGWQVGISSFDNPQLFVPSISNIHLTLNLSNLDANALGEAMKKMQSFNSTVGMNDAEQLLSSTFLPILTDTTMLDLTLSADTPQGAVLAIGRWKLQSHAAIKTSNDLLGESDASLQIKIAIPLYKKIALWMMNTPAAPVAASATTQPPLQKFNDHVAALVQKRILPIPNAIQIMQWANDKVPMPVFAANISNLRLPPIVMSDVNQAYLQLASPPITSPANQPIAPDIQVQNQADMMVKEGYLIQEGDSYTATLTYQNNTVLINGKMPPPATLTATPANTQNR